MFSEAWQLRTTPSVSQPIILTLVGVADHNDVTESARNEVEVSCYVLVLCCKNSVNCKLFLK